MSVKAIKDTPYILGDTDQIKVFHSKINININSKITSKTYTWIALRRCTSAHDCMSNFSVSAKNKPTPNLTRLYLKMILHQKPEKGGDNCGSIYD